MKRSRGAVVCESLKKQVVTSTYEQRGWMDEELTAAGGLGDDREDGSQSGPLSTP